MFTTQRTITALFFATSCLACVSAANAQQSLLGLGAAGWSGNNNQSQTQQPIVRQPAVQQPFVQQPAVQQPFVQQPQVQQPIQNEHLDVSQPSSQSRSWQPGGGLVARQTHVATIEFLVTDRDGRTTTFNRDYTTHVFNEATGQWVPQNNWRNDLQYHLQWMEQRGHTVTPSVVRRTQATVIDRTPGLAAPNYGDHLAPTN